MLLQLTVEQYDSLDQLYKAMHEIYDATFPLFMAVLDRFDKDENVVLTHDEYETLYQLAIRDNSNAQRMLGQILLSILENNPACNKPRREWDQASATDGAVVPATTVNSLAAA